MWKFEAILVQTIGGLIDMARPLKYNLEGQIFGYLGVGKYAGGSKWNCLCKLCNNWTTKTTHQLVSGEALMCTECSKKRQKEAKK